jgi:hypothetical protein
MVRTIQELSILETFTYVIAGWIVISVWQRFVENYVYNGLGMNRELPYHNFIVAMVATGIFIIVITSGETIMQMDGNAVAGNSVGSEFSPGFVSEDPVIKETVDINGTEGYLRDQPSYFSRERRYSKKGDSITSSKRRKGRNSRSTSSYLHGESWNIRDNAGDI